MKINKIIAPILIFISMNVTAAGRVYYNNFESGSSIGKCSIGSTALDNGKPIAGNGMAICNWDGVRKAADWSDPLADVTFDVDYTVNNELFIRLWQRADADFDYPSTGAKWFRFGPNSVWQLEGYNGDSNVHMQICADDACSSETSNTWNVPVATAIGSKAWHKYEIYFKNGSPGAYKVWLDGVLIVNATGNMQYTLRPLHVGSNWSVNPGWEHDANNHRYIDELEIYSDTGTGSTGSMANATIDGGNVVVPTTALAPPTNLKIVQ